MTVREEETFRQAIELCGKDHQLKMCLEEMAELQKEICKMWRNQGSVEAVAEETADVLVTLNQLMMIYDIRDKVESNYAFKVSRLSEKLKEGNYE